MMNVTTEAADNDYCFEKAATTYNISPQLLWAISKHESGHNTKAINFNKDGSFDFCHMQVNSKWRSTIGEERWRYLNDPCYCTLIGAWILSMCIQKHGYTWQAVGCYNSPSKKIQEGYANKIYRILSQQK
jgi:soluble lytic murein transglycosylase-like protein